MSRLGLSRPVQKPASLSASLPHADSKPVFLTRAVWTAVAAVVLLQGGAVAIKRLFLPSAPRYPAHKMSELPLSLGRWKGKEIELEPKTFGGVGSYDQVAREYKSAGDGNSIFVHAAAWTSQDDWTPHLPEGCYTTNGWDLVDSRIVALPGAPNARIAVQSFEQKTQRVTVAYWYQIDQGTYTDREGGRKLRRGQWGRRERSPLLKTMLQTAESDRAEADLLELASKIYDFNSGL